MFPKVFIGIYLKGAHRYFLFPSVDIIPDFYPPGYSYLVFYFFEKDKREGYQGTVADRVNYDDDSSSGSKKRR